MIELSTAQEERAQRLHAESFVLNSLALDHVVQERWFDELRDGGVDAVWVTLGGENLMETIFAATTALRFIEEHPDKAVQATTVAEMRQAKQDGKLAIVFLTQNAACLEGDYALLSMLHRLGYRSMGIAYSEGNILGDGCAERTRETRGLSYFGVDVVHEMNRLGILVDVSHCGDATTLDILDVSKSPVVATHSNARAISDTTRNKPDDQLRRIAESGGVIGITPLPKMVNSDHRSAKLEDYLDHIDHIVNLVGIDHVGIGCDFTDADRRVEAGELEPVGSRRSFYAGFAVWRERRPEMLGSVEDFYFLPYTAGFSRAPQFPNVTRGLIARGYDDESISKILGENWLRVFGEVAG